MFGYDVGNYLIEIGNQKCILPDGTTGNTESKLHLKKFTEMEISNLVSTSLRIVSIIERKLSNSDTEEERISLLAAQVSELSKILSVSVSMGLMGIEKS